MQYDKQIVSSESFREYESAVSAAWSLFGVVASGGVPSVSEAAEVYSRLESFEDSGGLTDLYRSCASLLSPGPSYARLRVSYGIFRLFSRSALVESGEFERRRLLAQRCFRLMKRDEDESGVLSDYFQLSGELEEIFDFLCHFARVVRSWWGGRDSVAAAGRECAPFPHHSKILLSVDDFRLFFRDIYVFEKVKESFFRAIAERKTGRIVKYAPRTSEEYCAIAGLIYYSSEFDGLRWRSQKEFDDAFCTALCVPRFRIKHSDKRVLESESRFVGTSTAKGDLWVLARRR